MGHEKRLRIKTLIMVSAMVVCATIGDMLLKRGVTPIGAVATTPAGVWLAFRLSMSSGTIWLAIFFLIGFMLINIPVLSWADYSYVMPASAFGYAVVTLAGIFVFGETVTPRRWIGVALICLGVVLVGQTKPRTTVALQEPVR